MTIMNALCLLDSNNYDEQSLFLDSNDYDEHTLSSGQ